MEAFDRIQKYNGGSYEKVIGAATATVFGLGAFTTTATAETIVTADVLNVRENRLRNQK